LEAIMAQSDASIFAENLKMWDRPLSELTNNAVLRLEDNVERIVDEMFERFMDQELDQAHSLVGNC
jgi:hypothetical protein